jgi:hypothetical protein
MVATGTFRLHQRALHNPGHKFFCNGLQPAFGEAPIVKDEPEPKPHSGPMKSLRKLSQRVLPITNLTGAETDAPLKSPRMGSKSDSALETQSPSSGSLRAKLQKEKTKKKD